MERFVRHQGLCAPFYRKDIDTDLIIPADFLTSTSKGGYGPNLFARLAKNDPEFVLNKAEFKSASILIAGHNFGCGSSREHAVWALVEAGFKVIIASSFADIFAGNAAKNRLVLVVLPEEIVSNLARRAEGGDLEVTVDLEASKVIVDASEIYSFEYDSFRKYCIVNGLDDVDYILGHQEEIDQFCKERAKNSFLKLGALKNK